jgi:hypothetical protein
VNRRRHAPCVAAAAVLHGASHQAPQEFQVVTDRPLPLIEVGWLRLRFVKKVHLAETPTRPVRTPTGDMKVSAPEATAFDLVRYPEHAGSLSNVATALAELAERCAIGSWGGLLGRPPSEYGRLRHGDAGHGRGARRRRAFMSAILGRRRRSVTRCDSGESCSEGLAD